jgi:hypothetical protein
MMDQQQPLALSLSLSLFAFLSFLMEIDQLPCHDMLETNVTNTEPTYKTRLGGVLPAVCFQ